MQFYELIAGLRVQRACSSHRSRQLAAGKPGLAGAAAPSEAVWAPGCPEAMAAAAADRVEPAALTEGRDPTRSLFNGFSFHYK